MDPRQVLVDGLGEFFNDGLFSGVGSMGVWRQKFTRMRALLEFAYASEEEKAIFAAAIQSAIIDAPDTELSVEERRALSDTVATVFDGNPKPIAADVAPRALFLRHMRIWPTTPKKPAQLQREEPTRKFAIGEPSWQRFKSRLKDPT